MYPPNLASNISAIQTAGWTSVIVSLFHINTSGDIYINDTKIFTGGQYIGSPGWPGQLQQLLQGQGSTITTLLASIGGGGVSGFARPPPIVPHKQQTLFGTPLYRKFPT